MPTSSQSQILSVVDYQLIQQQQASGQDGTIKPSGGFNLNSTAGIELRRRHSKDQRRPSTVKKDDDDDNQSPPPSYLMTRRRSSAKIGDGATTNRSTQRTDHLHIPIININSMAHSEARTPTQTPQLRRSSVNNDDYTETDYKLKQMKKYPSPISAGGENNNSSLSDLEYINDDEENLHGERKPSLLNESARRLLILGTIRPSRSFYRDLPQGDVEHLMEYFQRMRNANRKMTSEEINQDLKTQFIEYKPKIFFDSACVTKHQVVTIEKLIEQYADQIRTNKAELTKLDNPIRFVIKQIDNDTSLTTIPREYNDCFLTLVTRADPLRKSDLITELVREKFLEDIKANSLDISYFPGGVNYEVPREEIEESGQMKLETYQKLKQRLSNRKVWYFSEAPEKKPNALIAILPTDSSIHINHQRLLDCLYERLKTFPSNEKLDITQRILSIEFVPLSCIMSSHDISNQFIIDCDNSETKQQLMEKPLKFSLNKHSITVELQSYDEKMRVEYEKSIKAEKYRELIKNHDQAIIKRTSTTN